MLITFTRERFYSVGGCKAQRVGTPKAYMDLVVNLELLGQLARRRRVPRLSNVERAIGSMETRRFEPLE